MTQIKFPPYSLNMVIFNPKSIGDLLPPIHYILEPNGKDISSTLGSHYLPRSSSFTPGGHFLPQMYLRPPPLRIHWTWFHVNNSELFNAWGNRKQIFLEATHGNTSWSLIPFLGRIWKKPLVTWISFLDQPNLISSSELDNAIADKLAADEKSARCGRNNKTPRQGDEPRHLSAVKLHRTKLGAKTQGSISSVFLITQFLRSRPIIQLEVQGLGWETGKKWQTNTRQLRFFSPISKNSANLTANRIMEKKHHSTMGIKKRFLRAIEKPIPPNKQKNCKYVYNRKKTKVYI